MSVTNIASNNPEFKNAHGSDIRLDPIMVFHTLNMVERDDCLSFWIKSFIKNKLGSNT